MLSFVNDYSDGCHPRLLHRLQMSNGECLPGYGQDPYSASAAEKIRTACGDKKADVYFTVGGTQTNQTVIDALLPSGMGVLTASSGHINTHEAGTVELTGHKVLTLEHQNGKLSAGTLERYMRGFCADPNNVQMVWPGMVYISHPTEYGALYSRAELLALREVCVRYGLLLYLDGARLGYGLAAPSADLTMRDVAAACDAFYIGGTKLGALCGEAVVFPGGRAPARFPTVMKRHGALLAKGRLLGVQFDELFTDGLYLRIAAGAVARAAELGAAFRDNGYRLLTRPETNQLFVILDGGTRRRLEREVAFRFWEQYDEDHIVARFVTSWATTEADIGRMEEVLRRDRPC